MTTSTLAVGQRDLLDRALEELHVRDARLGAFRRARSSISSVMSTPYAVPSGPTRRAERITSMPPPEPRSSTVSPARSSATAVGLPQPRLASIAVAGARRGRSASYSAAPKSLADLDVAAARALPAAAASPVCCGSRRLRVPGANLLAQRLDVVLRAGAHRRSSCGRVSVDTTVERRSVEGEEGPRPALLPLEQTGGDELLQVVAHRRLRQPEDGDEVAHAHRPLARGEQVDDPHAGRIGERAEDRGGRVRLVVRERRGVQRGAARDGRDRRDGERACVYASTFFNIDEHRYVGQDLAQEPG